jgi:hypothetical protein
MALKVTTFFDDTQRVHRSPSSRWLRWCNSGQVLGSWYFRLRWCSKWYWFTTMGCALAMDLSGINIIVINVQFAMCVLTNLIDTSTNTRTWTDGSAAWPMTPRWCYVNQTHTPRTSLMEGNCTSKEPVEKHNNGITSVWAPTSRRCSRTTTGKKKIWCLLFFSFCNTCLMTK